MNWPSARSRRARPADRTVKREPESFAARSKSIWPSASPSSKCSFGAKPNTGFSPTLRISTLPVSSGPSGTVSSGTFGRRASASSSSAVSVRSVSSASVRNALICATSAFSASAFAMSLAAMAAPISLDAALRRICASCTAVTWSRRRLSRARIAEDCASAPRRDSARSSISGLSRIQRMSSMAGLDAKGRRARFGGFARLRQGTVRQSPRLRRAPRPRRPRRSRPACRRAAPS